MSTSSGQNSRKTNTSVEVAIELSEFQEQNCTMVFHDVMRLRQTLHKMASNVAATLGLQSTEMSAIDTLGKLGPLTMGELSKHGFISPTNTTRTVKILVDRNLVKRRRSPKSDREVNVMLTSAGEKLFQKSYPSMVHHVNGLLASRLNQTDRRNFARLLEKLAK